MKKWAAWLLFVVVSFSILEGYSIVDHTSTLSRFVWTVSAAFPPFQGLIMFGAGFLCCHFWWGGIVAFRPVNKVEDRQ